ncbi:MAG: FAD-dependent oxidoreductase [Cytophagaceae bacterium]
MSSFDRRSFISRILLAIGAGSLIGSVNNSCKPSIEIKKIPGQIIGASAERGHMLRNPAFGIPLSEEEIDCVIIGGGVSGLSAAWWLKKYGVNNFRLLELEDKVGGNSSFGANEITAYPWAAHYLPIPDLSMKELQDFLVESGIINNINDKGLPEYNEYYLCFAPEERLYINGYWQDGLIPNFGVPQEDRQEIMRFLELMDQYRNLKGVDGKYAFAIPLDRSSVDEDLLKLDKISFEEFLISEGFNSKYLFWYVSYCCRDDYGTDFNNTSAWAGIHYFASRKGIAANADKSDVLTWPEGNGFLTKKLSQGMENNIFSGQVVHNITTEREIVFVDYFDVKNRVTKRLKAKKCIVATPQFVTARLLKLSDHGKDYRYAPWMVANITLTDIPEKSGRPLSWDNVFYGTKSLGYVYANHQNISMERNKKVVTYYYPLSYKDAKQAREEAYKTTHEEWVNIILSELGKVHPAIDKYIENVDVMVWGHGMISPYPGFIWEKRKSGQMNTFGNKIFYAHSDLSGISIFEEAFYQGINAAKKVLNHA